MADEHVQQPGIDLASSGTAGEDLAGDEVEAARERLELYVALQPHSRYSRTRPSIHPGMDSRQATPAAGLRAFAPSPHAHNPTEEGVAQKSQPLRERLGWRTSVEEAVVAPGTPVAMATAGAWFAAAAALIAVLAVVLPHSPTLDECGLAWVAAAAAALALVAVVGYNRLPQWCFHAGVLAASAIATGAVDFWGEGADGTPLPYLWPTLYAFYFFSVRSALAHLAALGIMFAALLVARDPGYVPVAAWAATMGTLATVGLLVAFARDRLNTLIAKLSDAARATSSACWTAGPTTPRRGPAGRAAVEACASRRSARPARSARRPTTAST